MLEELFKLVKAESQNEIVNNPAIPNEHNEQAMQMATGSIFGGLQNMIAKGGLSDVMGMFNNAQSGNTQSAVSGITGDFAGGLMKTLGLDSEKAGGIASAIIPGVIGKLINKTNDPGDNSFNIDNIIGSLTGSSEGGSGGLDVGSILKNLGSGALDANHDGKINLDDLGGVMGGGQQDQNQNQSAGGFGDILKGLTGG